MSEQVMWMVIASLFVVAFVADAVSRFRLKARARLCNRWLSGKDFCTCSMCGPPVRKETETPDGD